MTGDMLLCVIKGDAVMKAHYNDDGFLRGLEWVKADPEIHVIRDLNPDPEGMAFLEAKYELGEDCPYSPNLIHARLRDAT